MGLAGLSVAMLGASANAEIESEFTVGYHTDYIFRGFDIGEDMMDFALDFAGTGYCDFDWAAGVWFATFDPSDPDFFDARGFGASQSAPASDTTSGRSRKPASSATNLFCAGNLMPTSCSRFASCRSPKAW